jgi:hypothetical protein
MVNFKNALFLLPVPTVNGACPSTYQLKKKTSKGCNQTTSGYADIKLICINFNEKFTFEMKYIGEFASSKLKASILAFRLFNILLLSAPTEGEKPILLERDEKTFLQHQTRTMRVTVGQHESEINRTVNQHKNPLKLSFMLFPQQFPFKPHK